MEPSPPRSPTTTPAAEPRTPPAASSVTTLATAAPEASALELVTRRCSDGLHSRRDSESGNDSA